MLSGKKIVVVLPAYNAEKTLVRTYREIPLEIVDEIILVDDFSCDKTKEVAAKLNLTYVRHSQNLGYGANQKTCYTLALKAGADIIIMLHPDYQYPPKLITAMAGLISSGIFDAVLGSRILGGYALKGGMPFYKYAMNRLLTFIQNLLTGQKLSEYHTGYRAFSKETLQKIPFLKNSDDFVFDNQMILQLFYFGLRIGEITATCSYQTDSSSINFRRSVRYGCGVMLSTFTYLLQKNGLKKYPMYAASYAPSAWSEAV